MFRILFAMLLMFMTGGLVFGQTPDQTPKCKLTVNDAPSIRGVRIGMTVEDVFALFPGSAQENQNKNSLAHAAGFPNFGVAHLGISPGRDANLKENFKGGRVLSSSIVRWSGRTVHRRVFGSQLDTSRPFLAEP